MSESILEVVRDAFVEVRGMNPDEVVPEASLVDDLGVDSLDAIEIILALETHYDKEFDGEDLSNIKTVGDVVSIVENILGQN